MRIFKTEPLWLPAAIEDVFEFFSNAANLNRITPPSLHFQMLTPPTVVLKKGTLLDYKLKIHSIPVRWQTEITDWEPPHRFADRQNRGPYKTWIHTHTFVEQNGGTLCSDTVEYEVPGWLLEPLINRFMVEPDIKRIFQYRAQRLKALF